MGSHTTKCPNHPPRDRPLFRTFPAPSKLGRFAKGSLPWKAGSRSIPNASSNRTRPAILHPSRLSTILSTISLMWPGLLPSVSRLVVQPSYDDLRFDYCSLPPDCDGKGRREAGVYIFYGLRLISRLPELPEMKRLKVLRQIQEPTREYFAESGSPVPQAQAADGAARQGPRQIGTANTRGG
jgi:hypothetical protein